MEKVELLAPAGNLEKLKFACLYGADAVYVGVEGYSLRAGADNFTPEELKVAVDFAHQRNVQVYAAINIFARNQDFIDLESYLNRIVATGVDALIVSDPGIFYEVRRLYPDIKIHISTQSNNLNTRTVDFWTELGAKRITLARELSLEEMKSINGDCSIETEIFIHGAMCISYSGRCHLSKYMVDRDANQGDCAHSCRWQYYLMEAKRPGEFYPIDSDQRGFYFFNSRDLCLAEHIPTLIETGIRSFKIEGRMKSLHYLATVVKTYRAIIDSYYEFGADLVFNQEWISELEKVSHRPYTDGFISGDGVTESIVDSKYIRDYDFVGIVASPGSSHSKAVIEVRNRLRVGDEIEFLQPRGANVNSPVIKILADGQNVDEVHANETVEILFEEDVMAGSLMRRAINSSAVLEISR